MINISAKAIEIINKALINSPDKMPRIILKNSGCAGHMLILTLDKKHCSDILIESCGITFVVENIAEQYISDVFIYNQDNLGNNLIIKVNNKANCKCGKSFRI